MTRQQVKGKLVERARGKLVKFARTQDKITAQNDKKLLEAVRTGDIGLVKEILADRTVSRKGVIEAINAAKEIQKNKGNSEECKTIVDELRKHILTEAYSRCVG